MSGLPDKAAAKSGTVWGAAIVAVGAILMVVGRIVAGDASMDALWRALMEWGGAIVALIGYIVGQIGQRRATGEAIQAAKGSS